MIVREQIQLFNLSALVTKLQIAFKIPESYGGDPNEIYESIKIAANTLEVEVSDWNDIVKSPEDTIDMMRQRIIYKYPDMGDYLNLGKIISILMIIGFQNSDDTWEPTRREQKKQIKNILFNLRIPEDKINDWFSACNNHANKEDFINSFTDLLESTEVKDTNQSITQHISVSGPVSGQLNIAGHSIDTPNMNITLSELKRRIDESDDDSKHKAKSKLESLLKHPLIVRILGSAAGGIIG